MYNYMYIQILSTSILFFDVQQTMAWYCRNMAYKKHRQILGSSLDLGHSQEVTEEACSSASIAGVTSDQKKASRPPGARWSCSPLFSTERRRSQNITCALMCICWTSSLKSLSQFASPLRKALLSWWIVKSCRELQLPTGNGTGTCWNPLN